MSRNDLYVARQRYNTYLFYGFCITIVVFIFINVLHICTYVIKSISQDMAHFGLTIWSNDKVIMIIFESPPSGIHETNCL